MMDYNEVQKKQDHVIMMARDCIAYYAPGWRFMFDRVKRRFGCCHYSKQLITISYSYMKVAHIDDILDTILHEIAHVIAGPSAKHGPRWRQAAIQVGANPRATSHIKSQRTETNKNIAGAHDHTYEGVCPNCGKVRRYYRKPKIHRACSCGRCDSTYNPAFQIRYRKRIVADRWVWLT